MRWVQRFANYSKALAQLEEFIKKGKSLDELEQQGQIQSFEHNFELAWNLIKDYYEYQCVTEIQGSRDAFRLAFNRGLIADGEGKMQMIESRIKTSHAYNEVTANAIASDILNKYYALIQAFHQTMEKIKKDQDALSGDQE